jgi:hypothetical protein
MSMMIVKVVFVSEMCLMFHVLTVCGSISIENDSQDHVNATHEGNGKNERFVLSCLVNNSMNYCLTSRIDSTNVNTLLIQDQNKNAK